MDPTTPAPEDSERLAGEREAEASGPGVRRGTEGWRGPEPSGWRGVESSAPASSRTTEGWRGPEPSGWQGLDARGSAKDVQGAARHGDLAEEPRAPRDAFDAAPDDSVRNATAGEERTARKRAGAGFSFFNRPRSPQAPVDDDDELDEYPPRLRVEERPRRLPGRRASASAVVRADPEEICPFLVAASGGWRLAVPSREHRCGAVNPPSPLSPQKQTRLCLTDGHLRCATFLAAGAARESRVGSASMPDRVSRWALARTTPVVEEVGGVRTTLAGMLADRRRWPAIPAMLLVVALATLGLSSLRGGGPVTALASPTPLPSVAPTVSIAPTPSVVPSAAPSPSASLAPSPAPTEAATPAPSHATYTVESGDTLSAIAKEYGTTVQAIVDLNGITDPASLKIGQVLLIP